MSQPFISVVMPVYKVENYLRPAVESLLRQTFSDYEIILVDDASPDASGAIADAIAREHACIRVIHKPQNEGLSMARNSGLEQVTGRYVMFMDSDDTVEPTLFAEVVASLEKNPAQVVVFGLVEDYYDAAGKLHHSVPVSYGTDRLLESQEDLRKEVIHLEEKTLYGYSCNKFYDMDFIRSNHLQFEVIPLIEDIQFNVKFFMDVQRVNILDCTPYHYNKRLDGSLTNRFVPDYFNLHYQRVQMLFDQYDYWGCLTDDVKQILSGIYVRYIFSALQRNCDPRASMSHADRKRFLKELFAQPLFKELIPYSSGNSRLVRWMSAWLNKRRVSCCLLGGRGIYIVKKKLPMVFAKAKQNR